MSASRQVQGFSQYDSADAKKLRKFKPKGTKDARPQPLHGYLGKKKSDPRTSRFACAHLRVLHWSVIDIYLLESNNIFICCSYLMQKQRISWQKMAKYMTGGLGEEAAARATLALAHQSIPLCVVFSIIVLFIVSVSSVYLIIALMFIYFWKVIPKSNRRKIG